VLIYISLYTPYSLNGIYIYIFALNLSAYICIYMYSLPPEGRKVGSGG